MKKIITVAICLFVAFFIAACGTPTPGTSLLAPGSAQPTAQTGSAAAGKKYNIALVMKTLTNPFFVEMEKGARQAEQEFGFNLIVKTGAQETSVEQQITIIQDLIQQKVDAILIAPADSVQLIPVLKQAQNAGIVIINIDNRLDQQGMEKVGLLNVPYISVDNVRGAYLSAKFIGQKVTSPTQAIIFEGIQTATNAQDRKTGAMQAFAENSNIQVVASETANWKIDEAHTLAVNLFKAHPDAKLVFCANDMMALGVIQYLTESGIQDVKVAAFDNLAESQPMLKDGTLQATIDQQAALQAYTGAQFALRALKGEKLPPVTLLDVRLVTRDNAQ